MSRFGTPIYIEYDKSSPDDAERAFYVKSIFIGYERPDDFYTIVHRIVEGFKIPGNDFNIYLPGKERWDKIDYEETFRYPTSIILETKDKKALYKFKFRYK